MTVNLQQWRHLAQAQSSVAGGVSRLVVPTANATVLGGNIVGDKAAGLYAASPHLQQSQWNFGQQWVIASEVVDRFVRHNGISDGLAYPLYLPQLAESVRQGDFTPELHALMPYLAQQLPQRPLMMRSSAAGDAAGTGTYVSVPTYPTVQHVGTAFREVVASYFSDKAFAYRSKTGAPPELAVMAMPLTAQRVESYSFNREENVPAWASLLSGWGVTQVAGGEALAGMVPGLFLDVEEGDVAVLARQDCAGGIMLGDYEHSLYSQLVRAQVSLNPMGPLLIRKLAGRRGFHGSCLANDSGLGEHLDCGIELAKSVYLGARAWQPQELFDALEQLPALLGAQYYVEWALTLTSSLAPQLWLNQIAHKRVAHDSGAVPLQGAMFDGVAAYGSGRRRLDGLVEIFNADELPALRKYNATHQNYGLIYRAQLASGFGDAGLNIAACGNAGALFCFGADAHALRRPIDHWGGALEAMDIWFGTVERSQADRIPSAELELRQGGMAGEFDLYSNPVRHRFALHRRSS